MATEKIHSEEQNLKKTKCSLLYARFVDYKEKCTQLHFTIVYNNIKILLTTYRYRLNLQ